jgi:hypothetical protein
MESGKRTPKRVRFALDDETYKELNAAYKELTALIERLQQLDGEEHVRELKKADPLQAKIHKCMRLLGME